MPRWSEEVVVVAADVDTHASSHQNNGVDQISVAGLTGLLATAQTPAAHKTSHQNGGSDEVSVEGLSGLLNDAQTPLAHKTSHQNGGVDEISVQGLSGVLAQAQTPSAHATSHHSGQSDALTLSSIAGTITDAQHGSRTTANAHAHSALSSVTPHQHIPDQKAGITLEDPVETDEKTIFFTNRAITVTQMRAVLANGSATPSVTWTIRHHTDRSNAGNEVVTGGTTTTSITTGSNVTSFNDATIPQNSFVWLEITAVSGTVPEFHVTIFYTID
jgi:hypothetical protein